MKGKPTFSFTKAGGIFIPPCGHAQELFPLDIHPELWPACDDAYTYTWTSDFDGSLAALSTVDRLKLSHSMGFCPHNRCQLGNVSSSSKDGRCPEGLCYTKLENGGHSFGACCFTHGAFDSGDLVGFYNKSQQTPKPIYRRSRVVLKPNTLTATGNTYSTFINANRIHPNIIATQCPLDSTVLDVQRMLVEQNVSLWIQLAPYVQSGSSSPDPSQQCTMTPADFVDISSSLNSSNNHIVYHHSLSNSHVGIVGGSFRTSVFQVELRDTTTGAVAKQRVTSVWYQGWEDFTIPGDSDAPVCPVSCSVVSWLPLSRIRFPLVSELVTIALQDMVALADYGAGVIRDGGTVTISCLSGRGRTGTFAALLLGRLHGVHSHSQLVDTIVQMREGRDGMLETPQQYRFVARALGLSDPAVCGAMCSGRKGLDENHTVQLVVAVLVGALLVLIPVIFMLRKKSI
jgi:protein tyrosine phosphatase